MSGGIPCRFVGLKRKDPEFNEPKNPGGTSVKFLQGEQCTNKKIGEFRCKLEMESLWISSEVEAKKMSFLRLGRPDCHLMVS